MENGTYMPELSEYAEKRDFRKTPEPVGGKERERGGIFVVQKHAARALHYDFRIELGGVLKSWAVPRGPSLNPEDRRLAVHVEDHPIEYADFEGIIPKEEYGGGTVMLWDQGFWIPEGDPSEGIRKGVLKFRLNGRKLRGSWALIRSRIDGEGKEEWLLIKERDEEARENGEEILEEEPLSVASGLGLDEISKFRETVWTKEMAAPSLSALSGIPGAVRKEMPLKLSPQLSTLVESPPEGDDWLHEVKYDGYRILSRLSEGKVELYTRNGNDWTSKFPKIASTVSLLPVNEAWLDGEAVFIKEDGTTSFEGLQETLAGGVDEGLTYYIFDILYFNGYDLTDSPLFERKELLESLLKSERIDKNIMRFSAHIEGNGAEFMADACKFALEGIISKRRDSLYRPGRGAAWLKTKCHKRQEFVIGGYTDPGGGRQGFGALLLGIYSRNGEFLYSGRVGTGFNEKSLFEIWNRLKAMEAGGPPFVNPPTGAEAKGVHWVEPNLVAEVEFSEWTRDRILRQPSFKGLRDDKNPAEVIEESPEGLKEALAAEREKAYAALPSEKIRITNPERVLYPEGNITKKELIGYYEAVSHLMLPHLKGRPTMLLRCPEGYDKDCFYQKHAADMPDEVRRIKVREKEGAEEEIYMTADTVEALLAFIQMGALEIHTWGSRIDSLEYPDKIIFDIDPGPSVPWIKVTEGAILVREVLSELGLVSFIKTTGGKGLHLVAPLDGSKGWEEIRSFTKGVAEYIAGGLPERFTSVMTKSRRSERIFIDYLRNLRGSTAVEAYSGRARPGAPVSMPVDWDELPEISPDSFNIRNSAERIRKRRDPWAGFFKVRQSITDEMKKRVGIK